MRNKLLSEFILFDQLASDPEIRRAERLFAQVDGCGTGFDAAAWAEAQRRDYHGLQRAMLDLIGKAEISATYWQNYLCTRIGAADNAFSRLSERNAFVDRHAGGEEGAADPSAEAIFQLAVEELETLRSLYSSDFNMLGEAFRAAGFAAGRAENIGALRAVPERETKRVLIHEAMMGASALESAVRLAEYYRNHGSGIFEGYDAFIWDGGFRGVAAADPVTMEDLVGYGRQKARLLENTEFLMGGFHANNVLLYGDSGTGKSSSVKALLNRYRDRGLKLISVPKDRIGDLSEIIEFTALRGLKYIIFIDDLSFEEHESSYKKFKSAIEGNISARADNTIICVTSNRRNIVKEVWKDRENQDDIHLRDNLQEKRSLSDRFGLTIVYSQPDKKEYLEIVEGLADQCGLTMDRQMLREQALTWEVRHGGRSGRTARQFIDHMLGISRLKSHREDRL